jgi:hypothetical protein
MVAGCQVSLHRQVLVIPWGFRVTLAGRLRAGLHVRAHAPIVAARENHQDPVTTFHLPSGERGCVATARTAARDVLRDSREIP